MKALLAESLRLMRVEAAACHERTRVALGRASIRCRVDEEIFTVAVDAASGAIMVNARDRAASIDVQTSREIILALVHCRLTVLDAVRTNALGVRGPVRLVEQLSRAMTAYLHGAVRSPSFPALLARLEAPASGHGESSEVDPQPPSSPQRRSAPVSRTRDRDSSRATIGLQTSEPTRRRARS